MNLAFCRMLRAFSRWRSTCVGRERWAVGIPAARHRGHGPRLRPGEERAINDDGCFGSELGEAICRRPLDEGTAGGVGGVGGLQRWRLGVVCGFSGGPALPASAGHSCLKAGTADTPRPSSRSDVGLFCISENFRDPSNILSDAPMPRTGSPPAHARCCCRRDSAEAGHRGGVANGLGQRNEACNVFLRRNGKNE